MNRFLTPIIVASFSLLLMQACAEVKQAGRDVGQGTRDVTRAIGHGARDVTKAIGHGTRDTVKAVGEEVKKTTE